MLAYAVHRQPARRVSPSTLMLIAGGHAALLAAVMAMRMDLPTPVQIIRTKIYPVHDDPPPPPPERQPTAEPKHAVSTISPQPTHIVIPLQDGPKVIDMLRPTEPDVKIGDSLTLPPRASEPIADPLPKAPPAAERTAPRLLTSIDNLRPPYPESKRRLEQEAVLRLRLSVAASGRVTAVEPVGSVDAEFLASARAHLIRAWRYAPAREGGTAVPTTITVTLRFQLDE